MRTGTAHVIPDPRNSLSFIIVNTHGNVYGRRNCVVCAYRVADMLNKEAEQTPTPLEGRRDNLEQP